MSFSIIRSFSFIKKSQQANRWDVREQVKDIAKKQT